MSLTSSWICFPSRTAAACARSDNLPFVHDPINPWSIWVPSTCDNGFTLSTSFGQAIWASISSTLNRYSLRYVESLSDLTIFNWSFVLPVLLQMYSIVESLGSMIPFFAPISIAMFVMVILLSTDKLSMVSPQNSAVL